MNGLPPQTTLRAALPGILMLTGLFFVNFLSRVCLSPLMPEVQSTLAISHSQAGRIFFYLASGAAVGLFSSSFLSERLLHRTVIALSSLVLGAGLLAASHVEGPAQFKAAIMLSGFGAGMYVPSGIAAITELVGPRSWGTVLSIHEVAPNSAFIAAPVVVEMLLTQWDWRMILAAGGVLNLVVGLVFFRFGQGGRFHGKAPCPTVLKSILSRLEFWVFTVWFCVAVATSLGPYAMLPLYLIDDHGYSRQTANELLALSRLSGILMAFLTGYLTDKLGAARTLGAYFILAGGATSLLGLTSGKWLTVVVLIQPALSVCFFPAAFPALSRFFEAEYRSTVVGTMTPFSVFAGFGLAPAILGYAGEMGSFAAGFIWLGCAPLSAVILLPLIRRRLVRS